MFNKDFYFFSWEKMSTKELVEIPENEKN